MSEDTVISLKNPGAPGSAAGTLTEILQEGAQQSLASAIEAELRAFLQRFQDEKTPEGLQRVARNGRLPKAHDPDRYRQY